MADDATNRLLASAGAMDVPSVQNDPSLAATGTSALGLGGPLTTPQSPQDQLRAINRPQLPALIQMLGQMRNPTAQVQAGQMPQAPSRLDSFESFLGNFLTSLASGMAASGHGPGANMRGAGAAMLAPREQNIQNFQMQQEAAKNQSQIEQQQAQTQSLIPSVPMTDPVSGKQVLIPPAHVGTALAGGYRMASAQIAAGQRAQTATTVEGMKEKSAANLEGMKEGAASKRQQLSEQDKFALAKFNAQVKQSIAAGNQEIQRQKMTQATGATRTMAEQSRNLLPQLDRIDKMVSDMGSKLGPVKGRWNQWVTQGYDGKDPDMANLLQSMSLLRTGMMRAHVGARGGVGLLSEFERNLNAGMTPEALHGSLQGMREFLSTYAAADAGMGEAPAGGGGAAPAARRTVDLTK